jgi:hypothetical protein
MVCLPLQEVMLPEGEQQRQGEKHHGQRPIWKKGSADSGKAA